MTSTNLSLYIPRVFENFDKDYVASKFDNFGKVDRVDFVGKMGQDGKPYNAAYIHFDFWYTGADAEDFANEVLSGKAHLYYDGPWFWIVLQNKGKKIEGGVRRPRIDLTDSKVKIPDYEEMYLMSLCKHNIIANSSFSWWGAWLNQNPNKIVIGPKQWLVNKSSEELDIMPKEWIKM